MPRQILPHLENLSKQFDGIISHYTRMLDDEFLFGAAAQIPQVATIFDRVQQHELSFHGENVTLIELLTLIAYRYGFEDIRIMGHGGYAIVFGHRHDGLPHAETQRRVLRMVPDHHMRDIIAGPNTTNEFDVRLKDDLDPLRDPDYPLLLSDLFLIPRHTTKLVFYDESGEIIQAGGHPAILHCQLLPEVRAFNQLSADKTLADAAGESLRAALATIGVSVADAHGGNGGVLMGGDGQPIVHQLRNGQATYIPVVLDYGYYAQIGPRTLATILIEAGATRQEIEKIAVDPAVDPQPDDSFTAYVAQVIAQSELPRSRFGRLLYELCSDSLDAHIWIERAEHQWQTAKERTYPALQAQSRLERLYPDYDEVIFPQRIEEYTFTI
jgi:hypothetical protein